MHEFSTLGLLRTLTDLSQRLMSRVFLRFALTSLSWQSTLNAEREKQQEYVNPCPATTLPNGRVPVGVMPPALPPTLTRGVNIVPLSR